MSRKRKNHKSHQLYGFKSRQSLTEMYFDRFCESRASSVGNRLHTNANNSRSKTSSNDRKVREVCNSLTLSKLQFSVFNLIGNKCIPL
jgi:hypothetical protein